MKAVRVRRYAWPAAHARLLALGVEFSTGVTVVQDDTSEGSGWVEVLLPAARASVLDRFPLVPREWDDPADA